MIAALRSIATLFNLVPGWLYAAAVAALVATNCTTTLQLERARAAAAKAEAAHDRTMTEYAEAVRAAEAQAREREQQMIRTTREIDRAHQLEKARLAAHAQHTADSLRQFQTALGDDGAGPADSAAPGRADGPARAVARECAGALATLDGHAQTLSARLAGLQSYAAQVCLAQGPPPD